MESRGPVLVTGATGNSGREVVRALERRGIPYRAAVRDSEGVSSGVCFDFEDPGTWTSAAEGCTGLFLLRPPPISDVAKTLNPFVDAARSAGIEHVTFLSVAGAESNSLVPHHDVETHLKSGSGSWTILRPGFFAQNLQHAYLRDIRDDDRLYVPAGRGSVAFVDLRDVAEVAALSFEQPDAHHRLGYTLTGPAAFTFDEVAALLTEALDRKIDYEPASIPGYLSHLRRRRDACSPSACLVLAEGPGLRWEAADRSAKTDLAGDYLHRQAPIQRLLREHGELHVERAAALGFYIQARQPFT